MWSLTRGPRIAAVGLLLGIVAGASCTNRPTPRDGAGAGQVGGGTTTIPTAISAGGDKGPAGAVPGFVAFGDFGGGEAQYAVALAMERWAADHRVDALVTTGDNVYERGEPEKFGVQLDQPYRQLRRTRPLWVTLGNHDVQTGNGIQQLRHLGLPGLPYAKTPPGVQLLFLDANRPD
jgi:hypothetical protein